MRFDFSGMVRAWLFTAGVLALGTASASAITIDNDQSFVSSYATDSTNIVSGGNVGFFDAYDQSHINMSDGHVSWLSLHNQSTANISGGDISWLQVHDNSFVRLTGLQDLSWLILYGNNAHVELVATNVSYSGGHLSGTWADNTDFSFWALQDFNFSGGMPANIAISAVPEPLESVLLALGLPLILLQARRIHTAVKVSA